MRNVVRALGGLLLSFAVSCATVQPYVVNQPREPVTKEKTVFSPTPESELPPPPPAPRVSSDTIGVILPLSGDYKEYGRRAFFALQIAAGIKPSEAPSGPIFTLVGTTLRLVVGDSQGKKEVAENLVTRLAGEYQVVAILGDILGDASVAACTKAEELGIPVISFARRPNLPGLGQSTFHYGLTPQQQAQALVARAIQNLKLNRFALLYPTHAYGSEMMKNLTVEIKKQNGKLVSSEPYNENETTFTSHVRKLLKQPSFDVLIIPDFPKVISYIVPELLAQDILVSHNSRVISRYRKAMERETAKPIQLMGTNSWNSAELVSRLGDQIDGALFVDGANLKQEDGRYKYFVGTFEKALGSKPGLFEIQVYDMTQLVAFILKSQQGRSGFLTGLKQVSSFPGLMGPIRADPSGEMIGPLYWFTVNDGEIRSIS